MDLELTMDRKTYMRDIYSKYWITAREKIYGFLEYDKNLSNYICKQLQMRGGDKKQKLLEVAIGTGYPFGDFFQKAGYSVYGIDIAPDLIEKCQQVNPNIICKVGDAEDLDFPDDHFDCTYCFHSTWYFPNLNKAIDEMLRVTRKRGFVIFDIQNRNNKEIDRAYRKRLPEHTAIRYAKNIAKLILRRGTPVLNPVIYEVPTYPETISKYLKGKDITDFHVMVKKKDESIEIVNKLGSFGDFGRLVFVIKR